MSDEKDCASRRPMTPQFTPGDYVRAVQITGLWGRWHEGHIMKVGRLVAIHDPESYWGSYEVAFGNGMKYMVLEIEPATKADYDADWPEEEPETPALIKPGDVVHMLKCQVTPCDNEGKAGTVTRVNQDGTLNVAFVVGSCVAKKWERVKPAQDPLDAAVARIMAREPEVFSKKTASAVLTAGNDPGLQFLRTQLKQAEQNLEFYEGRVADEKQLENTILDLIAARMDQLKGNQN